MCEVLLHVIGDMLGSVGSHCGRTLDLFFRLGNCRSDCGVIVAILIIISGFRGNEDSFHILMEGTDQVDMDEVKASLVKLDGVSDVHDLHIWTITSGFLTMSCHIVHMMRTVITIQFKKLQKLLHDEFGIEHSTIKSGKAEAGCRSTRDM